MIAFLWNEFTFVGAITNLSFDVKLFDPLGAPRRARVSISMEGRAFVGTGDKEKVLHDTSSADSFGVYVSVPDPLATLKKVALTIATRLV